jgi:hypothetical protein
MNSKGILVTFTTPSALQAAVFGGTQASASPPPTPPILFFDDMGPVFEPDKKAEITCYKCYVPLCEYLDAYYGKDDYWGRLCSKCRRKEGIK